MTAPAKPAPAKRAPTKRGSKKAPAIPADYTPSQVVAAKIIADRVDLTPSVKRIMESGMSEAGLLHAVTLFEVSLTTPGDPMRDPSKAIEAGQAVEPAPDPDAPTDD